MSLKRNLLWFVIFGMAGASLIAIWSLRQPLQHGLKIIEQASRPEPTVRFAVIGDNHGVNDIYRQAITAIAKEPVDFLLNLADTSEFGTAKEFQDVQQLEKALPFPVYHTVGNHDIKTDASRRSFTSVWHQSPNQTIDRGQLHLISLDNADRKVGFSTETLNWLNSDLAKNKNKTIIIAYHRPFDLPLASFIGDDETAASRDSITQFLQIIGRYHISYILTAHIHTYLPYSVAGIPAVVSGGGGDPAQTAIGGPASNYFHYLIITVKSGQVSIDLRHIQPAA